MKTFKPLIALFCLALILAACGDNATQCLTPTVETQKNLPQLTSAEAINLAKQSASNLSSPPRTFGICLRNKEGSCIDTNNEWPDSPGTKVASCTIGSDAQNTSCRISTITYTISLSSNLQGGGQYVTFISEWVRIGMINAHHTWQFYVGNDRQVQFLCEQGDPLRKNPE